MAATEKISISVGMDEIEWARKQAERTNSSLSSVVTETIRRARQHESRLKLLKELGERARVTPEEMERIRAEWKGLPSTPERSSRSSVGTRASRKSSRPPRRTTSA